MPVKMAAKTSNPLSTFPNTEFFPAQENDVFLEIEICPN
jgi:hypothetical protein